MSQRMWFRLADVLPLAEHALAGFTHRRTGIEARIDVPHGPALIWTGSPVMDLLVSNGVPTWHRDNGSLHAAEAYTWHDTSGTYGTAQIDGYDTAYLPLTTSDGSTSSVMDVLRGCRFSGCSWVTVDIDPADGHLIHPDRVTVLSSRHDLVPADAMWTPAEVTCRDVDDEPYPALIADGYTSDSGHLLARFDKPTVTRMTTNLDRVHANPDRNRDPMPGEYPLLRLRGDVLTVLEEHGNARTGADTFRPTDHLTPDTDGLYPLGAYLWPWRQAGHPAEGASRWRPGV